jgi:hypothetical protein
VATKPESPITLVVRRGALRRFNKLQKETADLPVVVQWDRRRADRDQADPPSETPAEERRAQPSFTWELADFVLVPGRTTEGGDEAEPTPPSVEPSKDGSDE